MSTFDIRNDAPGLLRSESVNVQLRFERTGPSTGRVSWNIPTPAAGCTAEDQAYCGMLVTLDTTAANLSKAPTNGTIYSSDATADTNLFAGDTIDTALVIGAYYQDRTTTFFDVTGLKANTPYYVSGYPVDCQYRYFTSGVHAYSQSLSSSNATENTSGTQIVALGANSNPTTDFNLESQLTPGGPQPGGVAGTDITGLVCPATYQFQCQVGIVPQPKSPVEYGTCVPQVQNYIVDINGCYASTYQDLVDEINKQFALLLNPPQGPFPPNTNGLYWKASTEQLFQWDGYEHVELPVIVQATDPTVLVVGTYWYNPDTDVLQVWDGAAWNVVVVIKFETDPTQPICDQTYWFDGAQGYLWNGTTWCELTTYISTTDPSVQLPAPCGSFWYDTDDFFLYRWNDTLNIWDLTTAIQYHEDPNALPAGTYWFDETNMVLNTYDIPAAGWNANPSTVVVLSETAPLTPSLATAGFALLEFAAATTVTPATVPGIASASYDFTIAVDGAVAIDVTIAALATDSMTVIAGKMQTALQLATGNTETVEAYNTGFRIISSTTGPASAIVVTVPTAGANPDIFSSIATALTATLANTSTAGRPATFWYNPSTQELFQWNGATWDQLDVLNFPTDPTVRESCDLWWDTNLDVMKVWDSVNNEWDTVATFYQQDTDPTSPPAFVDGDVWYNPDTGLLGYWQNVCFKLVAYISWPTDPTLTILDGTTWYDGTNWWVKVPAGWDPITPIVTTQDPSALAAGSYWFNTTINALQIWNGVAWVSVMYSTTPFTPAITTPWYNTSTNMLMIWNGTTWVPGVPIATVELDCNGNFAFTDTSTGSLSFIGIRDMTMFQNLLVPFRILNPEPGTDGVSGESSYNEIGIGTDGSNDERFKLMNEVRIELGYPVIDVELTQDQLDFCVSRAIEEIRGKSGIGYRHGFFFMRINSETQRYLLTNKVSGMNKIVNIQGIYRLTSAFLSSAHGAGIYGQIVLQHLYNMGTFDLLSYHIIAEYVELMEILFAARVTYTWDEHSRELWIHHRFPFNERMVLIECSTERVEQEIIVDRWCRSWIRRFAAATAREILAEIRGKYSTLPGAGGAVTLNASDLRVAATEMKVKLAQEIEDYQADKPEDYGMGAQLVIG